jgi:hypothetical protein
MGVATILVLPPALDGEAVTAHGTSGTLLAIISVASMAIGYVVLYLLWRFVFSAKARERRGEPPEY